MSLDYRGIKITEEIFNSPEYTQYRKERMKTLLNCGIYIIQNKINNYIYIGSSINIKQRFYDHKYRLKTNIHHNQHLQNAVNKYGLVNFEFILIEPHCYRDEILLRENHYIRVYKPEYNNIQVSQNRKWFHSKETKRKIGEKSKEKFIKNPQLLLNWINSKKGKPAHNKGKPMSEEQKQKLSEINSGKRYVFLTEESIQKIADKNSIPIIQYDLNMNFIKEWKSSMSAARFYGANNSGNFCTACKKGIKLYNSYWRKKECK